MKKPKALVAWAVISLHGNPDFIGRGQRGQHFIYWDRSDAEEFIEQYQAHQSLTHVDLKWKAIKIKITPL